MNTEFEVFRHKAAEFYRLLRARLRERELDLRLMEDSVRQIDESFRLIANVGVAPSDRRRPSGRPPPVGSS